MRLGTYKPAEAVHQIAEPAASMKQIDEAIESVLRAALIEGGCSAERVIEAREATNQRRAELRTLLSTPQPCSRSHPHEEMTAQCELRTEIARLTNALARASTPPAVHADAATDLKNALADAIELRQQLRLMEEHARGDVWRWQADAANELASMGNRMGVLIHASDLRNLLTPAHPAEEEAK